MLACIFNRLIAINYPQFGGNTVAYTYGQPGAAENAAGRITRVASQAGIEERGYGPLGELTRQTWTIASDTQGAGSRSPRAPSTSTRTSSAATASTWATTRSTTS
jgi:hypothetical protein